EKDGNDNALSDLATTNWIDNFDHLRSRTIAGGGPDGKIAAFYISTYAAFDSGNNLTLYHQGVSPFDADQQAKPGLRLESVLESLAEPVKRGNYAWVIL